MSFKQVNELRKNGQLQEAYEMATTDLNQAPDDVWAARAMFWTLHDMAFDELKRGYVDEATVLAERMGQLLPHLGEDESANGEERNLPDRAHARLVRHLQPFYQDIKMAYHEARAGDTIAPYDYIAQLITNGQVSEPLHERAGWIIWHHLWRQQQRMPCLEARQALAHYLSLKVETPSVLHSHILFVAVRLSKRFNKDFDFVKFLELWGMSNFMAEDWERTRHSKGRPVSFPSLVEQAVGQYIACKKINRDMDYSDEFIELLSKVVERFPDKVELRRYLSLSLLGRGDKERALAMHRQLAKVLNKYYVWHELAGMLTHDLDMKTSALCKALTFKVPETYTCEIHRELGWELAREENMPAALCELETYRSIRERSGNPRSWRYEQLRKRIPADTIAAMSNKDLYDERAQLVVNWVYADLPQEPALVSARFSDKQGKPTARLVLTGGRALYVKGDKIPAVNFLKVRVLDEGNGKLKLITADPTERDEVLQAFPESVTGEVKVLQGQGGKQYGFVEGCFVPGQLLQGLATGDTITILTEMQPDGRRRATAVI